ncbi:MAG: MarR family winged helix-turn-helix transcriptional regulator [Polyangiales bacterium]
MSELLFRETRRLSRALENWGETLDRGDPVNRSVRALLDLIQAEGPSTVPSLARARLVSRQHVQQQVDVLLAEKLVRRVPNPAHRRSSLIATTDRGRAVVENARAAEREAISRLQAGTSDTALREAAQVLASWTQTLVEDARRRRGFDDDR